MVIEKLKNIYNFKLIKEIREELRKKNMDFPSKSDIIFDISKYIICPVMAVRNAVDNIK
jgi:hypothetical protein